MDLDLKGYVLFASNVMKIGGILTVIGIGSSSRSSGDAIKRIIHKLLIRGPLKPWILLEHSSCRLVKALTIAP